MRNRHEGIALITALIVMVVVGILVFGTFFTTQIELWVTRNDRASTQAYYVAQAGLNTYKAGLFQAYRYVEGDSGVSEPDSTICFNQLSEGIDWQRDGAQHTWSNNRIGPYTNAVVDVDGREIGEYEVVVLRDPSNNSVFTVQSVGRSAGAQATLRSSFLVRNSGVLNYAIFANEGGGGQRLFNGGVRIHGGIYIAGNENEPDEYMIDTSGNFAQFNQYDLPNDLQDSSMANYVTSGNRQASNLCASLRVQHGKVEIGGSAQLGEPDNKLLGLYVGRGEEDITVKEEECKGNKGICAEKIGGFDLEEPPQFPKLDEAPEPALDACENNETWRDCANRQAQETGLIIERDSSGNISFAADGFSDMELADQLGDCAAEMSAALGSSISDVALRLDDSTSFDCTFFDSSQGRERGISFDGNGKLSIYGAVTLRGFDIDTRMHVAYEAKSVDQNGVERNNTSLFVEANDGEGGSIYAHGNVVPDTNVAAFPNHALALIAENDFHQYRREPGGGGGPIGGSSGNRTYVYAPIYAGREFRTEVRNATLGSVITDQFCTTSAGGECGDGATAGQAPSIFHIDMGDNRPSLLQSPGVTKPIFEHLSTERR